MKKELWADMLGCAIGALIGSLIAFEIQSRLIWGEYLWIVGAFIGGAIGWCVGEFGELWTSITQSFRVSKENFSRDCDTIVNWRPDKIYWKAVGAMVIGFMTCAVSSGLILTMYFLYGVESISLVNIIIVIFGALSLLASFSFILATVFCPFILCINKEDEAQKEHEKRMHDSVKIGWKFFKFGNPISVALITVAVVFLTVIVLVTGSWISVKYLWQNRSRLAISFVSMMKFVGKEALQFFFRIFVYAHSESRRIRFIGAFLGTIVGFFFGSAILGAVAGAIIGGISREIIAIRWLKLVPSV